MRTCTQSTGFSIIELMVVVAIIGVLAAIAIPNYQQYVLKTRMAEMISTNQQLMAITNENLTVRNSCFNASAGDTGEVQSWTPEYAANQSVPTIRWFSRQIVAYAGSPACLVSTSANPNIFGSSFDLIYLSVLPTASSTSSRITWQCYYGGFTNPSLQARIVPILPDGCLARNGLF